MRIFSKTLALLLLAAPLVASSADGVPASARSREAVKRVTPALAAALSERGLRLGSPIFLRIFKAEKELEVWVAQGGRYALFKTYPICAYSGALGPKLREGDLQSPEGFYYVTPRRMNPYSRFHLSFDLGYPNAYEQAQGRTGSALMVHGNCVSIGCYAMTDAGIEEIYTLADAALRHGQRFFRVHSFPFRMSEAAMLRHRGAVWAGFWENLKEGHDFFEREGRPPEVDVRDGRYVFR